MNDTIEGAFAVLGLPSFSSEDEIKAQYRRLALTHHPDKVHGNAVIKKAAHDQFSRISAAYELLTRGVEQWYHNSNRALHPGSCTFPHQLFRNYAGETSMSPPIIIPCQSGVSGLLKDSPMEEDEIPDPNFFAEESMAKRPFEDVSSQPSSPTTTAIHSYQEPPMKRFKLDHAPPPPLYIRQSIKRDSWSVDPSYENVSSKRMRRTICT